MEFEKKTAWNTDVPHSSQVCKILWLVTFYVHVMYKDAAIVPDSISMTRLVEYTVCLNFLLFEGQSKLWQVCKQY